MYLTNTNQYHLTLFPCQVTAFTSYDDPIRPLISQEVEIMAGYPEGPRPRVYSPPGSESDPLPPECVNGMKSCQWKSMSAFVQQRAFQ